jgi:hypothetical protein
MKMFRFCLEADESLDSNRNGVPDIRITAQILGFTILEKSIDLSPQQAFEVVMDLAKRLKVIN